ncbi:MAG: hypothetical protein KDA75_01840 [Planctomycetaceae bacterium]|nr:hypothetical protein [Planctomycetaceae bacterium]
MYQLKILLLAFVVSSFSSASARAQGEAGSTTPPAPAVDVNIEQQAILKDYQGFEKRLAELAESLRSSDIDRANLVLQARSESQRQQVEARITEIVDILGNKRPFADAVERQKYVVEQMEAILMILQTDAERDRLQARIKELEAILKETNRVIAAQKDVRADTERGEKLDKLQGDEQRVKEAAENLADRIDEQDARRAAEQGGGSEQGQNSQSGDEPESGNEPQPGDEQEKEGQPEKSAKPGQSPPGEQTPGDPMQPMPGEPRPGEQSPGQPSPSQQQPGQQSPNQPSQGQPSKGQPSEQQNGEQQSGDQSQEGPSQQPDEQQSSDQTPGRQQLEQAKQEMERAIEELKAQKRDEASNEQDQAIAQLEAMKAQIEEILRQLRQEEKELYLTMLEARFQEMLKLQLRINADTVRLDSRDAESRGEAHFTKSRDLGRLEQQNALAAEKALALLHEEGSSVAFPEAVEQMRSNMQTVVLRLSKGDTGDTTQLIEKLIVESLEEMVLSLQKELEKLKQEQQQQQQQQQQGQGQQDPPLVDVLAELKMIRSLQNQVNRLTKQVGLEIEGEEAQDPDKLSLLQDLSRRQERIQEATYDLSTGKNK